MSGVLYAYIAKPTTPQVVGFLQALEEHGVSVSHLGKSDPPRKFHGSHNEAASLVFAGTDTTNYTFGRDATRKLDFDIQIHHDPQWTHSSVSASSPNAEVLDLVAQSAIATFDAFMIVRGILGGGKQQSWEVVYTGASCPHDLRARFVAA